MSDVSVSWIELSDVVNCTTFVCYAAQYAIAPDIRQRHTID